MEKDDDGNLVINNDTLGTALTEASYKDTSTTDETDETPSSIFTVTSLENSSELESTIITVEVHPISWVRLVLDLVDQILPEDAEVMSEMAEVSEVSVLAHEPVSFEADEEENKVIIYEQVNKIDTDDDNIIEKEEIKAYLSKRPEYNKVVVPEGFKADFNQPLQLGTEVQLNEAGFIEVEFQAEVTNTKPSGGSTGGSGGGSASKPNSTTLEEPAKPAGAPATMYRLYNRLIDEHLYTTTKAKRDDLLTSDTWKDEGEGWIAPFMSDYPVYRLLNPNNGDHHYTIDKNEFDTLPSLGWVAEGVAFFSADKDNPENVILHRV